MTIDEFRRQITMFVADGHRAGLPLQEMHDALEEQTTVLYGDIMKEKWENDKR